jgi:peptide/nickel transport system substrate-binding protein
VNKDDSRRVRTARSIGKMLEAAGLEVTMSELPGDEFLKALKAGAFDLYVGQTKLSANMDLTGFFAEDGALNYGGMADIALHATSLEALANSGNYQSLHKMVMEDGWLCPVLFRSYAVYGRRGKLTDLAPTRDSIFYYTLGKTMEEALLPD